MTEQPGAPAESVIVDGDIHVAADGCQAVGERGGRQGPRRRRWAVAASLAMLAIVIVVAARATRATSSVDASLVGRRAPHFALPNLVAASPEVSLDEFNGRPTVINFWASWCVPCRREAPDLEAAHLLLGDRVAFVGIDHQDDRNSALEFVHDAGVTYPSGFDPGGTTAAKYGLLGLPTTVLIGPDGRVVAEVKGALTRERLLQLVADRLGVSAG